MFNGKTSLIDSGDHIHESEYYLRITTDTPHKKSPTTINHHQPSDHQPPSTIMIHHVLYQPSDLTTASFPVRGTLSCFSKSANSSSSMSSPSCVGPSHPGGWTGCSYGSPRVSILPAWESHHVDFNFGQRNMCPP